MRIFIFILLFPFLMMAQEEKTESRFIALYTLGENWDLQKPPNEQTHFKEHSAFLKKLRTDETITLGARYADTGMIIFKSTNLETAKALLDSDVSVQQKMFSVEVHPFLAFFKGCID